MKTIDFNDADQVSKQFVYILVNTGRDSLSQMKIYGTTTACSFLKEINFNDVIGRAKGEFLSLSQSYLSQSHLSQQKTLLYI